MVSNERSQGVRRAHTYNDLVSVSQAGDVGPLGRLLDRVDASQSTDAQLDVIVVIRVADRQ